MKHPGGNGKAPNSGAEICLPALLLIPCLIILIACFSFSSRAQEITTGNLTYPWAGGLNSCTFGQIDLNLDSNPDLVIFERLGNRIIPFIHNGTSGTIDYTYRPDYAELFPALYEWIALVDYNCDGKQDIFTYQGGGIKVFRNSSDTILKFELITNLLQSFYYTGYTGILGTPVDYPVFEDLDKDGDKDILTFFGLGSFVEYHRNFSMEKYGICDSLDFKLTDNCWGDFKESEGGNKITLDAVCPVKDESLPQSAPSGLLQKHTGSTMLAADLNGDGVQDLLLGDVDFPNLIALINGGTSDSAHMISMDSTFPGENRPVDLFSFPSCSWLDMDHDGLRDLVVSPFDPSLLISDNYRSVWYYKNAGTQTTPAFEFRSDRFFQDEMIDVGTNASPVLYDINHDGLQDLVIGTYGYYDSSYYKSGFLHSVYTSRLAYFENTGTPDSPAFRQVSDDFGDFSSLHLTGLYPAFADLDGDGDDDLIMGNTDGTLIYLENSAGPGHMPVYHDPVYNYQNIDVLNSSAPQLFDLDRDGLTDLVVGKQDGTISYFRNTGSATLPRFTLVTDFLGRIDVTNPALSYYGYSTPCFFRDKNLEIKLLVGSEEGKVHYFTDIENNLAGTFIPSDSLFVLITGTPFQIRSGCRTVPCIAFLSDPEWMDLVAGNFAGGLNYFSRQAEPSVLGTKADASKLKPGLIKVYPNPADQSVFIRLMDTEKPSQITLEVFNSLGLSVRKKQIASTGESVVSTAGLPDGIYLFAFSLHRTPHTCNRIITKVLVKH